MYIHSSQAVIGSRLLFFGLHRTIYTFIMGRSYVTYNDVDDRTTGETISVRLCFGGFAAFF